MNDEHIHHGTAEANQHEHTGHHADGHAGHDAHGAHAGHAGHDAHAGHAGHGDHAGQFRRLFWIMLVLAVPVVGFNDMFSSATSCPKRHGSGGSHQSLGRSSTSGAVGRS